MFIANWVNKSAKRQGVYIIWLTVLLLPIILIIGCDKGNKFTDIEYIQRAKDNLDKNELVASSIELKNALQINPDNPEARWILGQVYFELGKSDYAVKEFLRAKDLGLPRSEWVVIVAKSYMDLGEFDKVINSVLPETNDSRSTQAEIHALRGQAYISKKEKDLAQKELKLAREILSGDDNVEVLLAEARLTAANRDISKASLLIEKALKIEPKNLDVLSAKAKILQFEKNYDEAVNQFTKVLSINPYHQIARLERIALYLRLKKYTEAEKDLLQATKNHHGSITLKYLNALYLFQKQDYQGSQNLLEAILRKSPSHLKSRLLLGTVAYTQGKHELAERMLSGYLLATPGHLPAMKMLSMTYQKLGEPDKAIAILEPLSKIMKEDDPQILTLLGSAFYQNKEYAKAVDLIERATKLNPELAELRTQLALVHLAGGNIEKAKTELEVASNLDENFFQAKMLLIFADIRDKRYNEAIRLARVLIEKHPDKAVLYNLLSIAYRDNENNSEARKYLKIALEKDPAFIPALMNLANLDLQEGRIQVAKRGYEEVLKSDSSHYQAIVNLAKLEYDSGDQKAGIKWYEKAQAINPGRIEPSTRLVNYYISIGKSLKALTIAKQLVAEESNNPFALRVLGSSQLAVNRIDAAIRTFKKLSEIEKNSVKSQYMLAEAYFSNRDYIASRIVLEKIFELEADHPLAMFLLAKIEVFEGKEDKAMEIAQQLQNKHSDSPTGFRIEGDILNKKGLREQALVAYEKSYSKVPNADLALIMSKLRKAQGDGPGALDVLRDWLKNQPEDLKVRLVLASELGRQGYIDKSIQEYEKIKKSHPENALVWNNLAWLYLGVNDNRCMEYAEQAYKLKPKNPVIMDTLGWVLLHKGGDKKRGLTLLQDAAELLPNHLPIQYHLAFAYAENGETGKAIKELDDLLNKNKEFSEYDKAIKLRERFK